MEENSYSEKSWIKTLLLCWIAGIFGVHRTYVGKKKTAWIQFFTLGGLGFWALIDLYLIATQKFTDSNNKKIINNDKLLKRLVGIICLILCALNVFIIVNKTEEIRNFFNNNVINIIEEAANVDANITVFIEESANDVEINKLKLEIEKIEEISSIKLKSKEQGFSEYLKQYGDKAYLFESYADIIPNTYIVTIDNVEEAEKVCDAISNLENVKQVNNGYESLQIAQRQQNIMIFEKSMINIACVYSVLWMMALAIIGIEILDKENRLRKNLEI